MLDLPSFSKITKRTAKGNDSTTLTTTILKKNITFQRKKSSEYTEMACNTKQEVGNKYYIMFHQINLSVLREFVMNAHS